MNSTSKSIKLEGILPESAKGLRLDQAIAQLFPDFSRAKLQSFIRKQELTVNGAYLKPRDKVQGGELIKVAAEITNEENWQPEEIALDIVHEDESLLVINKSVGMVVHPGAGNWEGTLLNALLHHCPQLETLPRAGIIHRLDKDTSGLLVIAKTIKAHTRLVRALQKRDVQREYVAIVNGVVTAGGTVDAPIDRHPTQRVKMAVVASGKPAVTHYRVLERFRAHTLLKVMLETGRTHQIRVHMAYKHYPIVGDKTYGGRLQVPKGISEKLREALRTFHRQALHARRLGLVHPESGDFVEWEVDLPADMLGLLHILQLDVAEN